MTDQVRSEECNFDSGGTGRVVIIAIGRSLDEVEIECMKGLEYARASNSELSEKGQQGNMKKYGGKFTEIMHVCAYFAYEDGDAT